MTAYTYDSFRNLRSVDLPDGSQVECLVDGRSRRVGNVVDGETTKMWLTGPT